MTPEEAIEAVSMTECPDMFAVDPRPEVEAARLEMLWTEAEADRLGAIDYCERVPEGHPAYEAQGRALAAHAAYWQAHLGHVDLVAHPELEPDLGPTLESVEQGAEPDDAHREQAERDAEVARWPGGWTDGTGVSYRDYEANADLEERFERQREPEPDPEAEIA